jgi:hypothetical protein
MHLKLLLLYPLKTILYILRVTVHAAESKLI